MMCRGPACTILIVGQHRRAADIKLCHSNLVQQIRIIMSVHPSHFSTLFYYVGLPFCSCSLFAFSFQDYRHFLTLMSLQAKQIRGCNDSRQCLGARESHIFEQDGKFGTYNARYTAMLNALSILIQAAYQGCKPSHPEGKMFKQ